MKTFDPIKATDTQLLTRFEDGRDQCAFAELVRRHGPMVLATSRRVLASEDDCHDAFQAAFFALAKSADQLRKKEAVAGWLHRAVQLSAAKVQRENSRWQGKTELMKEHLNNAGGEVKSSDTTDPSRSIASEELKQILDEELARLPAKLHAVIVLCELQGLSQKQAASKLGIPASTVNERAAKGRKLLRERLVRRGVTLTLAGLAACVASSGETAFAMTKALVADTTAKATLFTAGKSAAEIGVATSVTHSANKVISAMTAAKFSIVGLIALSLLLVGTMANGLVGTLSTATAEPIFGMPSPLSNVINDGSFNTKPSVSSDNLTLYWTSNRAGSDDFDIWSSTRTSTSAAWGQPINVAAINSSASDVAPSISSDGLELYFTRGSSLFIGNTHDIWVSRRDSQSDTWGAPEKLGGLINTSVEDADPSISADGLELYFDSFRSGDFNIYVSRRASKDAQFGPPTVVIPSTGFANVSADGLLLFSSSLPDLAVSVRESKTDEFGPPKLLDVINTRDRLEYDGVLSADGQSLYFASTSPDFSTSTIWESRVVPEPSAARVALVGMTPLLLYLSRRRNRI